MTTGHEPLTQEERELAARLARLGVPDGPPPALDAKILAAAHDDVLRVRARTPAPRRRRWPGAIGAAASLVVVLGIAWQLRPAQDTEQVYSESDFVRAPRASGPSAAEELPVGGVVAADQVDAASAASVEAAADAAAPESAMAPAEPQVAAPSNELRQERADATLDEDRSAFPADTQKQAAPPAAAAPPAPAPPPPPPPSPKQARTEQIVFDTPAPISAPEPAPVPATNAAREAAAPQPRRQAATSTAEDAGSLDRIEVTGARIARDNEGFTDEELDQQPPATADSTEVQRAWLRRIREMLADGDEAGAKASLAEFKRRNPRYALPEDLQALLP